MPKYFLTVISDNTVELPIIDIAMSLGSVVDSERLKFQHSSYVGIFHFASEVDKLDLYTYIQGVLMGVTNTFVLTEHNDDVTISLSKDIESYMLDLENGESYSVQTISYLENNDIPEDDKYLVDFDNMSGRHQIDEYDENSEFDDFEDILRKIKNSFKTPSLDSILDKINEQGINSLTKTELKALKQYSN